MTYTYEANLSGSTFSENSLGRLTAAQYSVCAPGTVTQSGTTWVPGGAVTEMYTYHKAGAITAKKLQVQRTGNGAYSTCSATGAAEADYAYDSAGWRLSYGVKYPPATASTTYTYGFDLMGRSVSLTDNSSTPVAWAQGVSYDLAGRMTGLQYPGTSGTTTESMEYSAMGQLTSMSWSGGGISGGLTYAYSSTQNNGQVTGVTDTLSGETISYQYDSLKRLTSASAAPISGGTPSAWTQTYQFDGFGNLAAKVLNGTTTSIGVDAATNRLSSASYDSNGNMTSGSGVALAYDEANRVASATPVSGGTEYYGYAADNKRIYRLKADGTEVWTFYGAFGERLMADMGETVPESGTFTFTGGRGMVWFGGKLLSEGGSVVTADRLGTNRTGGARFYPYGEEISSTTNDRVKFGTYNRDGFTGLDYADQRFYASSYGRFSTPDKVPSSANPSEPGSLNRYSYVVGDPTNRVDPRGTDDGTAEYCIENPDACWDPCQPPVAQAHAFFFDPEPDPSCYPVPGGGEGGGGGGNEAPPQPTCKEQLTMKIDNFLSDTPLASEGLDFVNDSEAGGLNPLLLVAVAGAESQFGARTVAGTNNAFGLLHPVRKGTKRVYVPIKFKNWDSGIKSAVSTIDKEFVNGNVTIADLYSGLPGAYCVGAGCANGKNNAQKFFKQLGGGDPNNPFDLLWPCKD